MAPWCSGYHHYTTLFNKVSTQILCRFKPCSWRVGDLRWWEYLTIVPAGNKAETLSIGQSYQKNNSSSSSSLSSSLSILGHIKAIIRKLCFLLKTDHQSNQISVLCGLNCINFQMIKALSVKWVLKNTK